MGAFGGSYLNHIWLVCACIPKYPNADHSPAKGEISAVEADGVTLKVATNSPKSAVDGVPKFVSDGNLTPDFYAVNTMQPPYQPSYNKPASRWRSRVCGSGEPDYASAADRHDHRRPAVHERRERGRGTPARGRQQLSGNNARPVPNFQYHHQPFNYFASMAPGTAERAKHLKDGGLGGAEFIKAIDAGVLEQVVFYKPQGNLNEHAGYADVQSGDAHIADVIAHLRKSPQWEHMVVIVTYDENGGFWDHVAPPKGDRWGPGSRIPAIIVSPLAKKGFVDHTPYDTTSILRLITKRFNLPLLPGIQARDEKVKANGGEPLGDLTNTLLSTP
jgi:acid phosphatase